MSRFTDLLAILLVGDGTFVSTTRGLHMRPTKKSLPPGPHVTRTWLHQMHLSHLRQLMNVRCGALYGFSLLWQDRYLAFPLRDLYTGWHFQHHWFALAKERLIERMQSPQEQTLCLAECFRFLHAHSLPPSLGSRSIPRHEQTRQLVGEVESYRHAKDFFGRAFLPLVDSLRPTR